MYTNFFRVTRKPFENTPNPEFLYLSTQHREVLSSLIYGIEEAKGFVLVAGDIGTGKTTLLNALLHKIQDHIVITVNNPRTSFNEVFDLLMVKLGLPRIENSQLQETDALKEKLIELENKGTRVIILIDEAHLLSEQSLQDIRLLSNIETESSKLIQIILAGQNEVLELLDRESQKPLKQRIVINRKLLPLDEKETTAYINHRLQIAGRTTPLFNKEATALIRKQSRGIPRVINQICDNALLIGYAVNAEIIDCKIIKEVISDMGDSPSIFRNFHFCMEKSGRTRAIAASLILILGLFAWQQKKTTPETQPTHLATVKDHPPVREIKEQTITPQAATLPPEHQTTYDNETIQNLVTYRPSSSNHDHIVKISKSALITTFALQKYGIRSDTILDYIQRANKNIKDVNLIYSGQNITLPNITRADLIVQDKNKLFHLHYASFFTIKTAKIVTKRLQKEGKEAFFVREQQRDNTFYRVYVGNFTAKMDAIAIMETLDYRYLPFLKENKRV